MDFLFVCYFGCLSGLCNLIRGRGQMVISSKFMVVTRCHSNQQWKLMKERRLFLQSFTMQYLLQCSLHSFGLSTYHKSFFDNKYQFGINSSQQQSFNNFHTFYSIVCILQLRKGLLRSSKYSSLVPGVQFGWHIWPAS